MKYFVYDEADKKLREFNNKGQAEYAACKANVKIGEEEFGEHFFIEVIEVTEERYNAPLPEMKKYRFTDVEPGRKSSNGGEYGFYTDLRPTQTPGFFHVESWCTCDFDACGTGYEGVQFFTAADIATMQAKSDRVEAEGSQYCR